MFPGSYYLDVTNDGINDLIVSTNSENNSANFESCWLYENNGQNALPDFNFVEKNFLQKNMIDLGTSALPTFYDYNNDNLLDLIIGNYGYNSPNNNPVSSLSLFENIGNDSVPKYNLINRDWLNLSNLNLNIQLNIPALNLTPTFGDLNGDGNKDLIVGDADGKIHLFLNTGGGNFQLTAPNYQNIDVGQFAHPQLIDVTRNGLNDLIIGEQDGTINFLPNSGSINNAIFDTIITNWGGIDIEQSLIATGFSKPILYDSSGVYQLFVGSYSGSIYQFTNIDNNLNGQFNPVYSTASTIWDGGKSAIAIADINSDNQPEFIIGNLSGGIAYFNSDSLISDTTAAPQSWDCNAQGNCYDPGTGNGQYASLIACSSVCLPVNIESTEDNFKIYPNPAKQKTTISSRSKGIVKIYDLLGKTLFIPLKKEKELKVNTSQLSKGLYIIEYNQMLQKLIVE